LVDKPEQYYVFGNLQGGKDEEADGTMHGARSFRGVRDSDFVPLVA
jgi:hypothetical protein